MAETTPRKADSHIVPLYIRAADRIPMTELADQTHADLETRRRRARFRAWHRGMREADLILGRFADTYIEAMDEARMDEFETLLEVPDGDLLKWMTGEQPVPPAFDTPLFRDIRATASKL